MSSEIITIVDHTKPEPLDEDERGKLRDWFDTSGRWSDRMCNLYRLVEAIVMKRQCRAMALAWEQGWVAAGNRYEADDNPYANPPAPEASAGVGEGVGS